MQTSLHLSQSSSRLCFLGTSNCETMLRTLGDVNPLLLLTKLPYLLFLSMSSLLTNATSFYSAAEPLLTPFTEVNSPPLVSLLRRTICSRGSGGVPAGRLLLFPGLSFSRLKLLCLRFVIASPSLPAAPWALALGRRERSGAPVLECACRCKRDDVASREAGRAVEGRCCVVGDARAAKDVVERARTGGFEERADCGLEVGSSMRSHIELDDCVRVMRSPRLLPGVEIMGGTRKFPFRLVGVGGVRPSPALASVEPLLEPEPSRRPDEEAGRRRFSPMFEARLRLRLPLDAGMPPFISTSSQA